jgi:hypothetical protein
MKTSIPHPVIRSVLKPTNVTGRGMRDHIARSFVSQTPKLRDKVVCTQGIAKEAKNEGD